MPPGDRSGLDDQAIRQAAAKIRVDTERDMEASYERAFGLTVAMLLADPKLLDHFLGHDSPRLRADAVVFAESHLAALGGVRGWVKRFRHLTENDPAEEVRAAALFALATSYEETRDRRQLEYVFAALNDEGLVRQVRSAAYVGLIVTLHLTELMRGLTTVTDIDPEPHAVALIRARLAALPA